MHDDDELAASLTGLLGLLTGDRCLEQVLVRVAEFAVRAIPGDEGAGLTLLEADRHQTVVATDEFVTAVDDIQYGLGEGPCVSAVAQRRTFTSGNLGGEPLWPHFGPRVGRLGVHSALSLPLVLPGQILGALNVYAHGRDVLDAHAVQMGEDFSPQAAVSVHNAQALTSRAEIDQALGVVMSRTGATAQEAFDKLRVLSQTRSVKLTEVAHEVLGEALRRARARHTKPASERSTRQSGRVSTAAAQAQDAAQTQGWGRSSPCAPACRWTAWKPRLALTRARSAHPADPRQCGRSHLCLPADRSRTVNGRGTTRAPTTSTPWQGYSVLCVWTS